MWNSRLSTSNQNSSNKEIRTYNLHSCPPSMFRTACKLQICSSWHTELNIFNIQSEGQQQRDDDLWLTNFLLCLLSVWTACELRISSSWHMELEILNIQSEQHQQRDDDLRSPLMSAVHVNCLQTATFLFSWNTIFSSFSVNSSNTEMTTCQSPLVSVAHANCLQTVNLLFVEVTHSGHQNRQETNALNACNKWPVYSTNTHPIHISQLKTSIC